MLTEIKSNEILQKQNTKLPSKDERKKAKLEQEAIEVAIKEIKAKLEKFMKEEILNINAPVDIVEQIPDLLKSLINIYKTRSQEWEDYVKMRNKVGKMNFKDLTDAK